MPNPAPRPSPSVIAAFARREPEAVRAIYEEYGGLVYSIAVRVLGRAALAEDATQQTFVRAWQAADRIDTDRDPAPWLAQIAKRVAIDLARAERRSTRDVGLRGAVPDDRALDRQWRVRRAIDTLPRDEAQVMRLQHVDGLTQQQVAARLGIALGTVKSRSHRAHRKIAERLRHSGSSRGQSPANAAISMPFMT
jgi:RNA polymerase sigma-70 factor (ECF subfamily)